MVPSKTEKERRKLYRKYIFTIWRIGLENQKRKEKKVQHTRTEDMGI